jgi:hypothetical protein
MRDVVALGPAILRQQPESSISGHMHGDNCENDSGRQRHHSDAYHRPIRIHGGEPLPRPVRFGDVTPTPQQRDAAGNQHGKW